MNRTIKPMALFMALIVLCAMVCSVLFISNNTNHDCAGEACPICEQLLEAENTLRKISVAAVVCVLLVLMCVSAQLCNTLYSCYIAEKTPIFLRDKLLN